MNAQAILGPSLSGYFYEQAAGAMRDSEFRQGLEKYGHQIQGLTQPIWEGEYLKELQRKAS